jgi:hypothetical protein
MASAQVLLGAELNDVQRVHDFGASASESSAERRPPSSGM